MLPKPKVAGSSPVRFDVLPANQALLDLVTIAASEAGNGRGQRTDQFQTRTLRVLSGTVWSDQLDEHIEPDLGPRVVRGQRGYGQPLCQREACSIAE